MTKTRFSLAAAATLVLSTTFLSAQSAPADAGQAAKPSPYQGVSVPPANDMITTTEQAPAAPAVVTQPAPAAAPAPAPAPAGCHQQSGRWHHRNAAAAVRGGIHAPQFDRSQCDAGFDSSKDNTDDGIVTYVPGPTNALPEGTVFRVSMLQDIDAYAAAPNTPFSAQVTRTSRATARWLCLWVPSCTAESYTPHPASRLHGGSILHLRADEFVLPDGTRYHVHAQVIDTQGSDTNAKGEGNIVPTRK